MPKDLKPSTLRLKCGDSQVRTRGDLIVVVWKDERNMCLLTNINNPPRGGNYCNEHGNAIKPAIVADYNHHMGHVDNADKMANGYTVSRQTWKWSKKLFFTCCIWSLSAVTSFYLRVVGTKSLRDFRLTPIREMLAWAEHEPQPHACKETSLSFY